MDTANVDFETARRMVIENPNLDNYKKVIIDAVFNNDKTVYGSISLGGRNVINNASEAH
ncbi:hypothetical protein SPBRAN_669 [uncultured Candidatus Thioglobus sp.]|nr:hypothetical protein SPBRAN_669 [uncultured Candidatus Thioglobus sp.]